MSNALKLKEEGNRHFKDQDYAGAEGLYSQALILDPKNASLYTNRANARVKLAKHDLAADDCASCLTLDPKNMKALFLISQAQAGLGDTAAALASVLRAHELCVINGDYKSLPAVTQQVLQRKKEKWEAAERVRRREDQDVEAEVMALLGRDRQEMLADATDDFEERTIVDECDAKEARIRDVFERARVRSEQRREVPEWAIDDIGFGIMVDPVVTKTGNSYERASILEHLSRQSRDPLTREPLTKDDLRPNLGLKRACAEFLEENGWAVDW